MKSIFCLPGADKEQPMLGRFGNRLRRGIFVFRAALDFGAHSGFFGIP